MSRANKVRDTNITQESRRLISTDHSSDISSATQTWHLYPVAYNSRSRGSEPPLAGEHFFLVLSCKCKLLPMQTISVTVFVFFVQVWPLFKNKLLWFIISYFRTFFMTISDFPSTRSVLWYIKCRPVTESESGFESGRFWSFSRNPADSLMDFRWIRVCFVVVAWSDSIYNNTDKSESNIAYPVRS